MQHDLLSFSSAKLYLILSILFLKQVSCLAIRSSRSLSEASSDFFIFSLLVGASLFKDISIFFGGFELFLCFLFHLLFLSLCVVKLFAIIFEFSLFPLLSWDILFSSIRSLSLSSKTRLSKCSSFSSFLSTEFSILEISLILIKSFLFSSVFNSEWFSSNSLLFIIFEGWSKIWLS